VTRKRGDEVKDEQEEDAAMKKKRDVRLTAEFARSS